MEEEKNKTQQQPPSKKEQKQEAGQKTAEVAAKAAATYFGGKVGGQVAGKLLNTKAGKALTNKVGKKLARTPGVGNALNKVNKTGALDAANQGMDVMNSTGNAGGIKGQAGTSQNINATNNLSGSQKTTTSSAIGESKLGANSASGGSKGNKKASGSSSVLDDVQEMKKKIRKIRIIIAIVSACWPILLIVVSLMVIIFFFFDFSSDASMANQGGMCASGDNSGWWWPVAGKTEVDVDSSLSPIVQLTSGFGPRWQTHHNGIDISGSLTVGEYNVIASKAGTVIGVENTQCPDNGNKESCPNTGGNVQSWGNTVKIDHGNGIYTRYAHLAKGSIKVKVGDKVVQGQVVGKIGHSGHSTGAHLHFEVYQGSSRVDPENFVSSDNQRPGNNGSSCSEGNFSKCYGKGLWTATAYTGHLTSKNFDSNKDCVWDSTYGWCLYNGKIVVAGAYTSTDAVLNKDSPLRDDIYYFGSDKYSVAGTELKLKLNGDWHDAVVMDVCGVCINPNHDSKYRYTNNANTDWKTQVIDILYNGKGTKKMDNFYDVEVSLGSGDVNSCNETNNNQNNSNQNNNESTNHNSEVYTDVTYYSQVDSKYANHAYCAGSNKTIAYSGCGPTALAMVSSTLGGNNYNPNDVADYLCSVGHTSSEYGTADKWFTDSTVMNHLGISGKILNSSGGYSGKKYNSELGNKILNAVNSNEVVILNVPNHFVVVGKNSSCSKGKVYLYDPSSTGKTLNGCYTPQELFKATYNRKNRCTNNGTCGWSEIWSYTKK